jgi:hypothetical protein
MEVTVPLPVGWEGKAVDAQSRKPEDLPAMLHVIFFDAKKVEIGCFGLLTKALLDHWR